MKIFGQVSHNTGILLLVNLTGAMIGFLLAAALGRGLGDAGFGRYSFVMTWLLSLILLAEFGLSTALTRDVAARPEQTRSYLLHSLAGKGLLGLPAALLLLVFAPWLATSPQPEVVAALRWGALFVYGGLIYSSFTAVFKAHQVMSPILWLTLAGQTLLLAGTLVLLLARRPLPWLIAWAGISQMVQCLLALFFYFRLLGRSAPVLDVGRWGLEASVVWLLLVAAWPFALAGLLAALQMRANVLFLAYLQGDQAVGWYAAANRFIETGKQLPGAFYAAMLPAMAAMAGRQDPALHQTLARSRLGLLLFGLLAAGGALLLARPILTLTYGPAYQPATPTLQILALSLIPAGQNSLLIIYLYARGDEKFVNLLTAAGLVVNLSLCFWLIPAWGAAGTALALLVSESSLYLPYRLRARSYRPRPALLPEAG